jgi:exodeoxyribonuclease VII small subunit
VNYRNKAGVKMGHEATFEESMKHLEDYVAKLERGELPLEESIKAYEEAMKLVKICEKILANAERRIEVLKVSGNKVETEPLEFNDSSDKSSQDTSQGESNEKA